MRNFNFIHFLRAAGIILLLLLLSWLTVSAPFVYEAKQKIAQTFAAADDDNNTGTTDEKSPNNPTVNLSEEFLHETAYHFAPPAVQISIAYIHAHEAVYKAYHGEILCPPPNHS